MYPDLGDATLEDVSSGERDAAPKAGTGDSPCAGVMLVLVPGGIVGLAVVATGLAWVAERLLSRHH